MSRKQSNSFTFKKGPITDDQAMPWRSKSWKPVKSAPQYTSRFLQSSSSGISGVTLQVQSRSDQIKRFWASSDAAIKRTLLSVIRIDKLPHYLHSEPNENYLNEINSHMFFLQQVFVLTQHIIYISNTLQLLIQQYHENLLGFISVVSRRRDCHRNKVVGSTTFAESRSG